MINEHTFKFAIFCLNCILLQKNDRLDFTYLIINNILVLVLYEEKSMAQIFIDDWVRDRFVWIETYERILELELTNVLHRKRVV